MKKQILLLLLFCSIIQVNGQLSVTDASNTLIAEGDTVYVAIPSFYGSNSLNWNIHSESLGDLIFQAIDSTQPEGAINYYCFGSLCYSENYYGISLTEEVNENNDVILIIYYKPEGTYEDAIINYKVYNENNPSISTSFTIWFTITAGVNEQNQTSKFKLYPNPANGFVTIESKNLKVESCEIIDIVGKKVNIPSSTLGLDKIQYDVSSLKQGVYFVKIGNLVQKLYVTDGQ